MFVLAFFLHVLRCVGEGRAVLRGGVLWAVRSDVAHDHHDGTMGVHLLGHAEVVDAVVGNEVCQVVLWSGQTCPSDAQRVTGVTEQESRS